MLSNCAISSGSCTLEVSFTGGLGSLITTPIITHYQHLDPIPCCSLHGAKAKDPDFDGAL